MTMNKSVRVEWSDASEKWNFLDTILAFGLLDNLVFGLNLAYSMRAYFLNPYPPIPPIPP